MPEQFAKTGYERMLDSIEIRKKRTEDLRAVSELVLESFRDKYSALCGNDETAMRRIIQEEMSLRGRAGNFFVACTGGEIAGIVELISLDTPLVSDGDMISIYLSALGLGRGFRAMYLLSLLGRPIAPRECCISHLAVGEKFRRQGVARALIRHGKTFASEAGKKQLSLWVAAGNHAARRLYHSEGFMEQKRLKSKRSEKNFGIPEWIKLSRGV